MKKITLLILVLGLFTIGCSKKKLKVSETKDEFELYLNYWNEDGQSPVISFDKQNTDSEIRIDFSKTFGGIALSNSETNVIINNVRIIDSANVNYKIEDITAFEFREDLNNWKEDVEFEMKYQSIENINVMLILDASLSLGEDLTKVKSFAKSFINRIYSESAYAQIGVVDFSTEIHHKPLTNNEESVSNYIDNIQQGRFTSLYQAMDLGIDELLNSTAEGKAILTFTDGTDNNSDPQFTPSYLTEKLVSDTNAININSFTIGFEGTGGVDRLILEDLAANSGIAAFPTTISQLEKVFDKFSKSISNVYNLTYIRNQQIIPENEAVQLRFVINANPK